jgi:hypothetical protein
MSDGTKEQTPATDAAPDKKWVGDVKWVDGGKSVLPLPDAAADRIKEVAAERDRLKAAITEALNNAQDRLDYDCKCKDCTGTLTTVEATLREALGDAS